MLFGVVRMLRGVLMCVVALALPSSILSLPFHDSSLESLLVLSEELPMMDQPQTIQSGPPHLNSMHVLSNIRHRYARTVVASYYSNPEQRPQEATFSVFLPSSAFISGFVMTIQGKDYNAHVRDREQARKEYEQAVQNGIGAAHVAANLRDANQFTVSVNVAPLSQVVFRLTYEEFLVRKEGKYAMVVNLHPGQLVKDLKVDVYINETRKILLDTPKFRSGNLLSSSSTTPDKGYSKIETLASDDTYYHVSFSPTIQQQKELIKQLNGKDTQTGVSGLLEVKYDVERDAYGGEVLVNDGYFVHFFAPSRLDPLPKHVVFILDVSGSMSGTKINQLKDAMQVILGDLNEKDYFNVVKFHTTVHTLNSNQNWNYVNKPFTNALPPAFQANKENINKAKSVVSQMAIKGLTNIYDALLVGLRLTSSGIQNINSGSEPQPIIIFLTDGNPNVGTSRDKNKIKQMVQARNSQNKKALIFTLAFGNDADEEFLKELSLNNGGFMRKIYVAADAKLQLLEFYREITSPALKNVQFKYAESVKNITKHNFDILFKGSELVVTGQVVNPNPNDNFVIVQGETPNGVKNFVPKVTAIDKADEKVYGSLERLWVYKTIQELTNTKYTKANSPESDEAEKKALKLATDYSFVTPLTSLVVSKPNLAGGAKASKPVIIAGTGAVTKKTQNAGNYPRTTTPPTATTPQVTTTAKYDLLGLPWLTQLISDEGYIQIDNKKYLVGSNETLFETGPCTVVGSNLPRYCTLISACPKLHPVLNSLETYKRYFCTINENRYAGVCCEE